MPNAIDNPELYRRLIVAGARSPGVVTLSGHDRAIGWDVKKGAGQSGATTTRTSEDPVEFGADFYLVKDDTQGIDDLAEWDAFAEVLRSSISGAAPKALDTYHPDLAANDIKSVVLKSMGGAVHDGKGGVTYKVKLLEYRPPKDKGGSPDGSKSKASTKSKTGIDPNDPDAAALAELAKLTQEYKNTPWG